MTVPVQNPYNAYTVNGAATSFRYEFLIRDKADLVVFLNNVQVTTGFTVSGVGQNSGGDVVFAVAPVSGTLIIRRSVIAQRITDYQDNGPLRAEDVNRDFDRLIMMIQDKQADQDTALKHPLGQDGTTVKYTYDAQSGYIVNLLDPVNDGDAANKHYIDQQFTNIGQSILQQAQTSADHAKTSETNAATSERNAAASAQAAAASAGAASMSAGTASTQAGVATSAATTASGAATTATQKATAADQSAQAAAASAGVATTQAGLAAGSATAAGNSAQSASGSAGSAGQSAVSAGSGATAAQAAQAAAEKARDEAIAASPAGYLKVALNLSDVADKAVAWLNIRPVGATPLAADPVSSFDAATKRWVENLIGAGATGPTMNGVMNYGVGKILQHATRAYIPPYELPFDGQIVNRADWPELWAWAQITTPLDDSAWLADVNKRGAYSKGNGTTTFRLPDLNGVQKQGVGGFTGADSIPAVFFRGGAGSADMTLSYSAAPDVVGGLASDMAGAAWLMASAGSGAFKATSPQSNNIFHPLQGSYDRYTGNGAWEFKLSYALPNGPYGRNNTTEVVPNKVSGVWVVRASGGFIAANTSWSVLNGDATAPVTGATVEGGKVISEYQMNKAMHLRSTMFSYGKYLQEGGAKWRVEDALGNSAEIRMALNGLVYLPFTTEVAGEVYNNGTIVRSKQNADGTWPFTSPALACLLTNRVPNAGQPGGWWGMNITENPGVNAYGALYLAAGGANRSWLFNQAGNAISPGAWTPNSDGRIKKDKVRIADPLEKMRQMYGYTWTRLDGGAWGIGFLAQEVAKLFPEAVHVGQDRTLDDGTVVKGVLSPDTYGVAAALHHEAILAIMDKLDALQLQVNKAA